MTETIRRKPNAKLIISIILIVFFSIVTGLLNVGVFYLFGIPIFGILLGIIFVWFSDAKIKTKILLSILPFPLMIAALILSFQIGNAEPETFLIPQNLRGEIVVFYDEPCGQELVFENGRRIYKIPENGVLITKFKKNPGRLDQKFYLIDENGNQTPVPYFQRQDFESEKRDWKYFHSTPIESLTNETVGAFFAYGSETYGVSSNSLNYIISNYQDLKKPEKERWIKGKQFAKTAEKLLRQCR